MPEKIVLADGSEREVPTSEELKALNDKAAEAAKLPDLQKQLDQLAADKKELEAGVNPDWRKIREAEKARDVMIEQLRAQGKTLDPNNKIVDLNVQPMSADEIDKRSRAAAIKVALDGILDSTLAKYDTATQEVIRKSYNKLTAGEEVTQASIHGFIESSLRAAGINQQQAIPRASYAGGGDPIHIPNASKEQLSKGVDMLKSAGYQFNSDPNKIINK